MPGWRGLLLRSHAVNSICFFKYQQAAKRNTKPNKPLPHPINNYLVLLEFHGITVLETKIPFKKTSNFPVFQKKTPVFFHGSGRSRHFDFSQKNPHPCHSFSGNKHGRCNHPTFWVPGLGMNVDAFGSASPAPALQRYWTPPPQPRSARKLRAARGCPTWCEWRKPTWLESAQPFLVLSLALFICLLGGRTSKSETIFRDSLGEGNVVEIHNIKHNLAPVLLWWCQLTSKKWIQMMNISLLEPSSTTAYHIGYRRHFPALS